MDGFGLTESQIEMRGQLKTLLDRHLPTETIRALEAEGRFPEEAYAALAEAGWLGLIFDPAHGGAGGDYADLAVVMETMGHHWTGISHAVLASIGLAGVHIHTYGDAAQKATWLPRLISGRVRMAFALSEPEAGSDAAAIRTRATPTNEGWALSGRKQYITGAHVADHLVVAARTDRDAGRHGISMFLVDARARGVSIRRLEQLGRRCCATSEIAFDQVALPPQALLGPLNGGWPNLMRCLGIERLILAATYAGNCFRILDEALAHAQQRHQFGQPIGRFQAVAHKLADIRILAESARLHAFDVARRLDAGAATPTHIAIAKVICAENNFRCADLGMQVMGGAGYMMEHDMQRYFRDARVGSIGGGTSEIQRNIIARQMGL